MKTLFSELKTSLVLTAWLIILCCAIYPLVVWGGAQALFPKQAAGSLIFDQTGAVRGSSLLAQNFSSAKYFQPRASAAGTGYDATSSGGTNLGPTSKKLSDAVTASIAAYKSTNGISATQAVPADAVTSSGSGLDPDISVANASAQAARVAAARHLSPAALQQLVTQHTEQRGWGIFGEPRVNVLELNLALDQMAAGPAK